MGNNPYLKHVEILLQIIVEAQFKFVNDASCHSSFDHVLENLLELTHSQYGFIGEVLTNEQGTPPFKTLAISNVAWNEETRNLYDQLAPNLELSHLDALFEKVIVSGQHVIANGPGSNPRCGPLPKEHPPLHAFLGVPFFHGTKMVGMVGLANRPGGYDEQMVEFLKPLLTFCGTVLQAHRNECNRRKTEVARREIEERVSLALDASGSGVWDWNVQTGQVYYSQNWIESLGYKPREVPPNIKFWENLVHPDDLPKVNARLSEHFEGKTEIYECENRLRMASGGWRWDVNRGRVIEWDREGKPLRMVGVDKDISHRKFLEEKNLTLQYALDHGREGYAMLNEMGRFTYINPTHAELYGYTTEELIGQSWHGLYSDDQCTNFYDTSFPVLQSQGWWQGELEGKKKNGEIFDVEVFLTLLKNEKGEQKGLLCTCRDITERKQLEVPQKSSEQGIRELYEIASRYDEPWEERIAALLEMGCRRFKLPIGVLTQLKGDSLRVEFCHTPHNEIVVGVEFPKDQIFCGETLKSVQPLSFENASLTKWKNHPGYTTLGLEAYIGVPIIVDRHQYGTLAFASQESRKDEFTDAERDFIQLMVQWVGKELARKQSEAALRDSESKLQAVLDGSSSVIYMKDLDCRYLMINRTYEKFFHLEREKVNGLTDFDIFPQDIATAFQRNDQKVADGKEPLSLEEIVPHTDGPHTYMSNKFPLLNHEGVPYATCGISTDITDRKRTEHALRESEIRFRTVADTAPVLIWMSDTEKLCTYVNKTWLDFTGRTMEQELGHGWIDGVHPDDQQGCLEICTNAFLSRTPFEMEFRLNHADGHYRWILDRGVPRLSPDGKFLGYIGSCSDISEQKLHQEAIRRYNQLLEEEVNEQTQRIHELDQRHMQVEKLAALSQVAAGVAHEINNPLASIKQSFHLLKKLLPAEHPRLKYVAKIDEEIDRIAHIIQKMYQLHQPRQAHPQLLDLGQASVKAVELIQGLHKDKGVPVKMRLHEKLLMLPLPPTEVHQVLCNLIQNAFEAVEGKGKITISTGMDTRQVWISIADNGHGIPTRILPHIFDPFFSTKSQGSGSGMGLGLSVSKSLVEAMGGVLEVESKPGSGTTFTILISLPLVPSYPRPEKRLKHAQSKNDTTRHFSKTVG